MLKELLGPDIQDLIREKDYSGLKDGISEWEAPEIADLLVSLPEGDQPILFRLLPRTVAAQVFAYLPSEEQERRLQLRDKPVGFLGSALVGMAFGFGWTPCIGPVLGAILSLAATSTEVTRGMLLLGVYSAGLALPFLVAAYALDAFLDWFQRFRKYLPWVMRASGALLVLVGLLLVSGEFTRLAGWLQALTPDFIRSRI